MVDQIDVITVMMILGHEIEYELCNKLNVDNRLKFFMYVYSEVMSEYTLKEKIILFVIPILYVVIGFTLDCLM